MEHWDCLICRKHENKIGVIYQNEILFVSHYIPHPDGDDNYLGYYFIETKRHFKGIYEATDEEITAIAMMQKNLSKALMTIPTMEHVYSFIIGEGVGHFHVHIIGRYKNTPKAFLGPMVDEWPEAPRGTIDDIAVLDEQIKAKLYDYYKGK